MSNLRLIKDQEIVDGVSTVSVTDCFSEDYDVYKITINNLSHNSGSPAEIYYKFINHAGTIISQSEYDSASLRFPTSSVFGITHIENHTQSVIMGYADLSPEVSGFVTYIFNPFSNSRYTYLLNQNFSAVSAIGYGQESIGVLTQLASMTGFHIMASSNTLNSGNIKIYGLRVDV